MKDLIYAMEPLAYYFGITPQEFWSSTYKEINTFCQANLIRKQDDFKLSIILQEETTNKLIMADAMSNKRPKVILLKETFKNLFQKK